MITGRPVLTPSLMACLCLTMIAWWPTIAEAGSVDVRITSDLKRVIIQSEEPIGHHEARILDSPPHLLIDIAGGIPGAVTSEAPPDKVAALKAHVSASDRGTRVVLFFGGSAVPEYRIHRMDRCLIVFLENWTPPAKPMAALPSIKPKKREAPRNEPSKPATPITNRDNGDLIIKSADVIDGRIVLKVTERSEPSRLYRIDLGLNLERLGFTSASVQPMSASSGRRPEDTAAPSEDDSPPSVLRARPQAYQDPSSPPRQRYAQTARAGTSSSAGPTPGLPTQGISLSAMGLTGNAGDVTEMRPDTLVPGPRKP